MVEHLPILVKGINSLLVEFIFFLVLFKRLHECTGIMLNEKNSLSRIACNLRGNYNNHLEINQAICHVRRFETEALHKYLVNHPTANSPSYDNRKFLK